MCTKTIIRVNHIYSPLNETDTVIQFVCIKQGYGILGHRLNVVVGLIILPD